MNHEKPDSAIGSTTGTVHDETSSDVRERGTYEAPLVSVAALRLVTLGGSSGAGDSGAEGSENPFGGAQSSPPGDGEGPAW